MAKNTQYGDEWYERELHTDSYRPGVGAPPEVEVRGYDDPGEGEMTVLTFPFLTTAVEIHLNRQWLDVLSALIEGVEQERRVARGMAIVRRVIAEQSAPAPGDGAQEGSDNG